MNTFYKRPFLIELMSILLAFTSFINCMFFVDAGSNRTTPEGQIKVMSFNLRQYKADMFNEHMSAKRVPVSIDVILEELPDSVGVQESDFGWTCALNIGLAAEYKSVSIGRDSGWVIGEATAIYYRYKKYNLVDCGTFWLSETPNRVSKGWDAMCNRVCTWAVLQNKETNEEYVHINTHLDHQGQLARENGSDMILELAAQFQIPVVCTGDFNTKEGTEIYDRLTGGCLYDSKYLAEETMSGPTSNAYSDYKPYSEPIDYIFVSENIKVNKYHIITERENGFAYSDHFPVYIEMNI